MSDESIINLSDSTKATMRNYAMVAGFMTLFIFAAVLVAGFMMGYRSLSQLMGETNGNALRIGTGMAMVLFGTLLAFMHKRDQIAITFLLMALFFLINPLGDLLCGHVGRSIFYPVDIIIIILGIAMLFTRNEQKYVCALILLPCPAIMLTTIYEAYVLGHLIIAIVSLYAVLCIGLENPKFPGYQLLTADEDDGTKDGSPVHFKVSGSILGYALMMIPLMTAILSISNIWPSIDLDYIHTSEVACGLMLIFVGFLMLTAGRMKFTPFMFMIVGIIMALQPIVGIGWLFTLFLLIIAILCLFRSDRKVLVGVSIVCLGLLNLFGTAGAFPNTALSLLFMIVPFVILTYVCLALCSDNRLKLI